MMVVIYLFIITILLPFLHLLCHVMSCILQAMYYTSITFQTCYVKKESSVQSSSNYLQKLFTENLLTAR